LGVVEFVFVFVPVFAPVVPVPAAVLLVVLFEQFIAGLPAGWVGFVVLVDGVVGVVGGGFVLWAKAGAVSPAARLAADARPRILAPRVIYFYSPRRQFRNAKGELPTGAAHYEEREPASQVRLACRGMGRRV
jgi:hypothetical protein